MYRTSEHFAGQSCKFMQGHLASMIFCMNYSFLFSGCQPLDAFDNGNIAYLPSSTPDDNGLFAQNSVAINTCEAGFRVSGPSGRICVFFFVNNVYDRAEWSPSQPVTCERKYFLAKCTLSHYWHIPMLAWL